MDEYDVIYLDDERNAIITGGMPRPGLRPTVRPRPGSAAVVVPPSRRPTVIRTSGGGMMAARQPVVIQQQPAAQRLSLAGLSTGELLELAAQILAAIQPLPAAPNAQGNVETDVENLVIYQSALATHAKRDEQLRTLGGLLGKLLK